MSIQFLKPSRCVLLIGDDALYVYNVTFNAAKLVDTVPWGAEGFEETVAGRIRKDCGGKSVLILNDMTDQHFKGGQRLPKVGPLDRANVLQRRLHVAFPNYPIRGALSTRGEKGGKGLSSMFLFSAVPMSEPIIRTFDSVKRSMAPIAGFCLLPVESASMVKQLSEIISKKRKDKPQWAVFIGQHQNGALRQVITRGGQLAMTRMTPLLDSDADAEAWASEVLQEFKATISYLSRFGYAADDGTDVIVIANPAAGEALERKIDIPCHYTAMTATEAGRMLGSAIGAQVDGRYADALHAAWAGRKASFTLPMEAPDLQRIHKPRQVATLFMLLLLGGFGYLSWQLMTEAQSLYALEEDLDSQKHALERVDLELTDEIQRMKDLGFDVNLIEASMDIYNKLERQQMRPLPFLSKIGAALGTDLRLDRLEMTYIPAAEQARSGYYNPMQGLEEPKAEMSADLYLSFPTTIDLEIGYREVRDLTRRLSELLPDHKVVIEKQVADRSYKGVAKGQVGGKEGEVNAQDYEAAISIRGPAQ